jgi:hypothetical protein
MMNPLIKGMPTNTNMTLHGRNTSADNAPLLASQLQTQAAQAVLVAAAAAEAVASASLAKASATQAATQAALALDVAPMNAPWSPDPAQTLTEAPAASVIPTVTVAVDTGTVAPRILQRTIVKTAVIREVPKVSPSRMAPLAAITTSAATASPVETPLVDPRVSVLEVQLVQLMTEVQAFKMHGGQQTSMHAGFARSIDDRVCQVEKKCASLETTLTQLMMRLSQVENTQRQNHEEHATAIHDLAQKVSDSSSSSSSTVTLAGSSPSSSSTTTLLPTSSSSSSFTPSMVPSMVPEPSGNGSAGLADLTARVAQLEDHLSTIPELPPKMAALYTTCQDHMVQNQARLDTLENLTNGLVLNLAETAEEMDVKLQSQMQSQVSFYGTVTALQVPLFLDEMLLERPIQGGSDPRELAQGTKVLLFLPMKAVGASVVQGLGTEVLREVTYCACRIMTDPSTAHIREFYIPLVACVEWLRLQVDHVRPGESVNLLGDFELA